MYTKLLEKIAMMMSEIFMLIMVIFQSVMKFNSLSFILEKYKRVPNAVCIL